MAQPIANIIAKATEYQTLANNKARCHFVMSENAGRENLVLGIFTTLFSSIVGTAIFAALSSGQQAHWIQITTGFMSVTAAVLAAFQTFFRFSDVSAQNKAAAVGYEKIKLAIDLFLLKYDATSTQTDEALVALTTIVTELEKVEESSPSVPDGVFRKVIKK